MTTRQTRQRNRLAVWCYTAPEGPNGGISSEIGDLLESLSFTSEAPGGFGQFEAQLSVTDARIPRPEFALFSRIAVLDGLDAIWLGEVMNPSIGMDAGREYIRIGGLGLGNGLRDDPYHFSYSSQTARQIAQDQLTLRIVTRNYLQALSADFSQVFPDNPSQLLSPAYDNRNAEEVLQDLCVLSGDYVFAVWEDPVQRDRAGFPLGRVEVKLRDTATTHWTASIAGGEVSGYQVTPSAERAYNHVAVDYTDGNGVGTKIYVDPRLEPTTLGQGSAPFRYRKYLYDATGISTVSASVAQNIANTYGALYSNVTNKVSLTLRRVRDANGNLAPLYRVRAGQNIYVPDLAVRGATLPQTPTPGVNQFYIVRATYRETASDATLTLECDNWVDRMEFLVARLHLKADLQERSKKQAAKIHVYGAPAYGHFVIQNPSATSGSTYAAGVQFQDVLYQPPTSVSFTPNGTITGLGSPTASRLTVFGFNASAVATLTGAVIGAWTYQTNGNTLLAVDEAGGTFDWHCDGCDHVHGALPLGALTVTREPHANGAAPGISGIAVTCPTCGRVEAFNTALRPEDEASGDPHRAAQAILIRFLMRHPEIGLPVVE